MNGAPRSDVHHTGASPIVSVFMPVYNGERFIAQAIESLLKQTFQSLELIIVNDGSTDQTEEVIRPYTLRDSRVRILRHEYNRGLSAARNTGWQAVSPDAAFIMNHDCDDISLPRSIETLVEYLTEHEDISAVGSFCDYIDQDAVTVGWAPLEWQPAWIRTTFGRLNSMAMSATLVRRNLYEQIAPFQKEFGSCDDYNFWSRSLQAGFRLANVPRVLHLIRLHPESLTSTRTGEMSTLSDKIGREYREAIRQTIVERLTAGILGATLRPRVMLARVVYRNSGRRR
jgi:glycosyltransferase involved in cell wall biosynthesis